MKGEGVNEVRSERVSELVSEGGRMGGRESLSE